MEAGGDRQRRLEDALDAKTAELLAARREAAEGGKAAHREGAEAGDEGWTIPASPAPLVEGPLEVEEVGSAGSDDGGGSGTISPATTARHMATPRVAVRPPAAAPAAAAVAVAAADEALARRCEGLGRERLALRTILDSRVLPSVEEMGRALGAAVAGDGAAAARLGAQLAWLRRLVAATVAAMEEDGGGEEVG